MGATGQRGCWTGAASLGAGPRVEMEGLGRTLLPPGRLKDRPQVPGQELGADPVGS